MYAVRVYDPDSAEEIWSDKAAHFGVIYDLRCEYGVDVLMRALTNFMLKLDGVPMIHFSSRVPLMGGAK
jgi:hypothetical protein